ncbi:MAG: NgoPII family restriction endonuclease [Methanobrevibacter sp.]|nr:NgoPII family restriction endonuclease [Methanobrevibacter sp.]
METNTLKAIINIKNFNKNDFDEIYPRNNEISTKNRINSVGDSLEFFVKDAYSNGFNIINKDEFYEKYFSFFGSKNHPPDAIVKHGDAIEVKKTGGFSGDIQLNSSYPKSKLFSDSPLITNACRICEDNWIDKDMVYVLGVMREKILVSLLFIYGDCFAAERRIYEDLKDNITSYLENSNDASEFSKTNEIGRLNNVDPLKITNLRIRGMWLLKNPYQVFEDFLQKENKSNFSVSSIILKNKFDSFPDEDKKIILDDEDIEYKEIRIKNPNNPAQFLDAVLIRYDRL